MAARKSPSDYLSVIVKRRRTVAALMVSALTAALLLSIIFPKVYESKITFYLPIYQGKQVRLIGTPKELVKSNVAIPVSGDAAIQGILQILLSKKVATYVSQSVPQKTADDIKGSVNINVSSEGIFTVKYQDRDPEISTAVANDYPLAASQFLEDETGIGKGATSIRAFIEGQLRVIEARADSMRDRLSDFLQKNEVVAVDKEVNKMMDLYANLKTQKFTTQIQILENQVKSRALEDQMEIAGTDALEHYIGTNEVILSLREKAANLEIKIAELKLTYTEEHPEMMALRAALEETQAKLKEEIEKIFESYTESINPIVGQMKEDYIDLQINKAILSSKNDTLDTAIKDLEDDFFGLSGIQYDFAKIKKEGLMLNKLQTSLMLKLEELKFQELQSENRFVILDEAVIPKKPVFPNVVVNLLTTLALSFLVSVLLCLLWESREEKRRERVIEEMTSENLQGVFLGE